MLFEFGTSAEILEFTFLRPDVPRYHLRFLKRWKILFRSLFRAPRTAKSLHSALRKPGKQLSGNTARRWAVKKLFAPNLAQRSYEMISAVAHNSGSEERTTDTLDYRDWMR